MQTIYADHAATKRLCVEAEEAMLPYFDESYGNPSSLHSFGREDACALSEARETIARCIGAHTDEIYFTSGGTGSDTQAVFSAAERGAEKGKRHLVTSKFEHHAAWRAFERLEKQGFAVTWLDVYPDGLVRIEDVRHAIRDDTAFVSIMYANNEIGTVQLIGEIGALCRGRGVPFHTDAVQAAGHIPIHVQQQQVDMLSLSAHKFHGPKGTDVLYCKKRIPLRRLVEGGAQERRKRAGTQKIPAIVGLAAALDTACRNMARNAAFVSSLRDKLIDGLTQIPRSLLNGDRAKRLSGTINLCFEGIEGEFLLLLLNEKGIAASSGSACTSGSLEPSHVLLALGLPPAVAHGSPRLSLSEQNTGEEIQYILHAVPGAVAKLRDMSPVWEKMQKEVG